MRMLIHGLKSLIRRPAKTVMLFIIFFIVFNLVFVGLIIQNSIYESKEFIRNQIGSAVEYRMDFESMMSANRTSERNFRQAQNLTRPPSLSLGVADKISKNHYVKSCFISESANVNSDTIDPAETQESGGVFMRGFGDFILQGTNRTQPLDFVMGNVKMAEGSPLTDANVNNGDNVILVSKDVAGTNDLRIGDTVSLARVTIQQMRRETSQSDASVTTAESDNYEIIGIYEAVKNDFNINTIFASNVVVNEINGTSGSDDTNASIVFLLDSPNNVDAFIKEATPYLTSPYHVLYSNNDEYESLTKPLDLLSFITSILIWVVLIAGVAIILAIVTIFVRDRKFEIGLLLSSGEGKLKIISQFILEMLVIAVLAFGISVGSSNLASRAVSNWIVENQLLSQDSLIADTAADTNMPFAVRIGGSFQASGSIYGDVDMQSVAEEFNVSLNASVMLQLLFASILIVIIGSNTPLVIIMRYKPKRILQDY